MQLSIMAYPAKRSTTASPEDHSGISTERQQLLLHTELGEDCTHRESADHHERSTRCQLCGQDEFRPKIEQRCENIFVALPVYLALTIDTVVTAKSNPLAPGSPKQTLSIRKHGHGSRDSHVVGPRYAYR